MTSPRKKRDKGREKIQAPPMTRNVTTIAVNHSVSVLGRPS